VIGYSAAIRLLDNGRYDKHLAEGMEILACIMEAVESNWITLNIEKQIIVWRWLLAAVFITEELEKTELSTFRMILAVLILLLSIPASMAPLASTRDLNALHSTILSWGIEKYGPEVGQQLALRMYQDMVVADEEFGFRLSALGREGLTSSMTALSNTSRSNARSTDYALKGMIDDSKR
jgi:hypothetical protein